MMYLPPMSAKEKQALQNLKTNPSWNLVLSLLESTINHCGKMLDYAEGLQKVGQFQGARGVLREIIDKANEP